MKKRKKGEKRVTVVEKILSKKEIIAGIAGGLAALYPVVNVIYNMVYQSKCEDFYGIPGKYFHSNVDNRLIYLVCIILLIGICAVPSIIKKQDNTNEKIVRSSTIQNVLLSIVLGLYIGLINIYNLLEIMKQTYKINGFFGYINSFLNKNAIVTIVVIIILGSITVVGITFADKMQNIKLNYIKRIWAVVFLVSFVVSFSLMIYGTMFKLSIKIEDKTKYEFTTIGSTEYVVLSEHEDKILIIPFEIKEDRVYIFKTNQYSFIDKYEGNYKYVDIKISPIVDME